MVPSEPSKVIGLLGGTFNPAHAGHLHISQYALEMLPIDALWWLVSYDHPVKAPAGLMPFAERMAHAAALLKPYRAITVSDFEQQAGTRYTIDTLLALEACHPNDRFIWLMGADNLTTFHNWHRWDEILNHVPIVVFNRGNEKIQALTSPFAVQFSAAHVASPQQLSLTAPYNWCFLDIPTHPASSTELREK